MKSPLLLLMLIFLFLNVLSQENDIVIEGSIKDADGVPIENVNVFNGECTLIKLLLYLFIAH